MRKSVCLAVALLVAVVSGRISRREQVLQQIKFIQDYVEFYNIKRLCVIRTESNSWLLKMSRTLTSEHNIFTSVLGLDNTVERVGLNDTVSKLSSRLEACQGFRVMKLQNLFDYTLFKEIFAGKETTQIWLIVSGSNFAQMLKPLYLSLSNRITIANFTRDGKAASLWEVYQVTEQHNHRVLPVGRWAASNDYLSERTTHNEAASSGNKISVEGEAKVKRMVSEFGVLEAPPDDLPLRRKDLTGLHLRCTTLEYAPLTIFKNQADGTVRLEGFFGKVFDAIKYITNLTSTCRRSADGQWGVFANGSWTGMIKEVADGSADIAVAPLGILADRSQVVTFLISIADSSYGLVMRRPSNEDYMWTVYTKQFHSAVWWVMVSAAAILALCLHLASCSPLEDRICLSDSAMETVGILLTQGTTLTFRSTAGRLVILTGLLLQVVTLAFYTSNLVSALAVGPSMPRLKGLRDVHNDPSLTFGLVRGSSNVDRFRISKRPLFQEVWRGLKDEDLSSTVVSGMERVRNENYALMVWEIYFKLNLGTDCRVFMLPELYLPVYTSFALPKDSPLIALFNKLLLDIMSSGLFVKSWMEIGIAVTDCSTPEQIPIELKTVLTAFLLLGIIVFVSLAILGIECYLERRVMAMASRNIK